MNLLSPLGMVIAAYAGFGACFGLLSFSRRHLFSEGPSRRADDTTKGQLGARLAWALVCSGLWPLMALTGLYSWWRMSRAARNEEPR